MTLELDLLKSALMKIVGNFGGSKHALGSLLKKHSKNHHNGRFVGLLRAVDPRMAGYAISFLRLLRLRPVIELPRVLQPLWPCAHWSAVE